MENTCRSAKDSNQIDLEAGSIDLFGEMRFNLCVQTIKIQKDRKLQVHFIGKSTRRAGRGKGKWGTISRNDERGEGGKGGGDGRRAHKEG